MRGCAGITDAAFVHLRGIHTLDIMHCAQATLTEAALAHLAGIAELNVYGCRPAFVRAAKALGLVSYVFVGEVDDETDGEMVGDVEALAEPVELTVAEEEPDVVADAEAVAEVVAHEVAVAEVEVDEEGVAVALEEVVPLPEARLKLTMGRLVIRSVAPDAGGECVNITFNPMVLPKGVDLLEINGLRLGEEEIDLQVHRSDHDVGVLVRNRTPGVDVLIRK
jgi:hypothetical protein